MRLVPKILQSNLLAVLAGMSTCGLASDSLFESVGDLDLPHFESHSVKDLVTAPAMSVSELLRIPIIQGEPQSLESDKGPMITDVPTIDVMPSEEDASPFTRIVFQGVGEREVLPKFFSGKGTVFVRDPNILAWHPESSEVEALGVGSSEIYVVLGRQLRIVPVQVKGGEAKLRLDDSITDISNQLPASNMENLGRMSVPYNPVAVKVSGEGQANSLNESNFQIQKLVEEGLYKTIAVQVLDERSEIEAGKIYPIANLRVSLVGSSFSGLTNAKGIIEIADVPAGSRFLVRLDDPEGRILSQVMELATEFNENGELFQLRSMSYNTLNLYGNVFQSVQRSDLSSLCLRLMSKDGAEPLEGLSATLNVEADGPYYIGDYGPDISLAETASSGRLCFFNVSPGLVELSIFEDDSLISGVALPLVAGHHLDDDIYVANGSMLNAYIVSLPNAAQTAYGDGAYHKSYYPLDFTEINTVGTSEELSYQAPGILAVPTDLTYYRGRIYNLVKGAEFETSLYSYDPLSSPSPNAYRPVLRLLPRGFVEDLFQELYLNTDLDSAMFDPALGHMVVWHGLRDGERAEDIKFRLVDAWGRSLDSPWIIGMSNDGFVKAVFFNLNPGVYSLVVESGSDQWLDATVAPVDYWLTSFVSTGAKPQPVQAQE